MFPFKGGTMRKFIVLIIIISILGFLVYHEIKTKDLSNTYNMIIERIKDKKPNANTLEMVDYLIEKAKDDSEYNDSNSLNYALNYIKENIEKNDNKTLENLIYYGALLQYSPKESADGMLTTIGMKTVKAVKDVYVKDSDYKKERNKINKTEAEIINALISRVDIS